MFSRAFPDSVYAHFYPERQDDVSGYALPSLRYAFHSMVKPRVLLRSRRLPALAETWQASFAGKTDEELKTVLRRLQGEIVAHPRDMVTIAEFFAIFREVTSRTLGLDLGAEHLRAGWCLLQGTVVNFGTGGGKTLVAAMAGTYASFARVPVHVVHLDQKQAEEKCRFLEPLYRYLGVSSGIGGGLESLPGDVPYAADIIHVPAQVLALDYLRDSLLLGRKPGEIQAEMSRLSSRKGHGAIRLRGLPFAIIDDAESLLLDMARKQVAISDRGENSYEDQVYAKAVEIAKQLRPGEDFLLNENNATVELTEGGRIVLARLTDRMEGVWMGQQRRENLIQRALTVVFIMKEGQDYSVDSGTVQFLDGSSTRRLGPLLRDRAWQKMVEVKESLAPGGQKELRATLTYQRLFQRYCMLAGVMGSGSRVGREIWEVYRLGTINLGVGRSPCEVSVSLNCFLRDEDKWVALEKRVEDLQSSPALVVVVFNKLSVIKWFAQRLKEKGIVHEAFEGQTVAREESESNPARKSRVLLVTAMQKLEFVRLQEEYPCGAGDIHCLIAEKPLAQYQEENFIGLCGREGRAGKAAVYISPDDDLLEGPWFGRCYHWLLGLKGQEHFLVKVLFRVLLSLAQRKSEARRSQQRLNAMRQETASDKSMAFTGSPL